MTSSVGSIDNFNIYYVIKFVPLRLIKQRNQKLIIYMKKILMRATAVVAIAIGALLPAKAQQQLPQEPLDAAIVSGRYSLFCCFTQDELPYTAFNVSANTYTENGALIDKTANPIRVAAGVPSFTITYYGWTNTIGSASKQMDWTQEAYYIDWNKNGQFTDDGEISEKGNTSVPNTAIYTGFTRTVTIPEGQPAGIYRMRTVFFEPADNAEEWQKTL